jgi:hypothetical protein
MAFGHRDLPYVSPATKDLPLPLFPAFAAQRDFETGTNAER